MAPSTAPSTTSGVATATAAGSRTWLRAATALVLAALLAGTSGCGDDGGGAASSAAPSRSASAHTGGAPLAFGPVGTYLYEGSDPVRLELGVRRAVAQATASCMTALGWRYVPDPIDEALVRRDLITNATSSALADEDFRTAWGYGLTRSLLDPAVPAEGSTANASGYAGLTAPEQDRYDHQLTGCLAAANGRTGLDDRPWREFRRLQDGLLAEITARADVEAAADRWVACMRDRGYGLTSPAEASQDLEQEARALYDQATPDRAAVDDLHRREVARAADDWACQRTTTVAVWTTARDAVERAFVDDHVELLDALRRSLQTAAGAA